ncbi:PTS system cellobiose-specific IIB component [Streptococcus rupicaprae]|uniref:PTS system cellobiose-specific IIB component n=2 Tax=Streptococcus rupicaprae TaxID=759619 RepID=A0ABV2FEU2_9STRE
MMKHIMLVCNAGMSTSLLVTKMEKAAADQGYEATIWAVPVSEVDQEMANKTIDVLMVGPQVRFMLDEYKQKFEPATKVTDINMMDYGIMNGEAVFNQARALIGD